MFSALSRSKHLETFINIEKFAKNNSSLNNSIKLINNIEKFTDNISNIRLEC